MKGPEPDTTDPGPFARALRAGLADRGLSLTALRARLQAVGHTVSLASLSYWRSGRRVPGDPASFAVVEDIEKFLDLAAGTLLGLVRPRRQGRPPTRASYDDLPGSPAGTDTVLAELGLLGDVGLLETSSHVTVDVDAESRVRWATNRQVLVATRESPDRLPAVLVDDVPFDEPPRIEAIRGCRLGRRIDRPADGVSVVEVLLETPPAFRSATMIETRLHFTPIPPQPWEEFGYHLTTRLLECAIVIEFAAPRRNEDAFAFTVAADGSRTPVPCLVGDRDIQCIVHEFGPGRLYVHWAAP